MYYNKAKDRLGHGAFLDFDLNYSNGDTSIFRYDAVWRKAYIQTSENNLNAEYSTLSRMTHRKQALLIGLTLSPLICSYRTSKDILIYGFYHPSWSKTSVEGAKKTQPVKGFEKSSNRS